MGIAQIAIMPHSFPMSEFPSLAAILSESTLLDKPVVAPDDFGENVPNHDPSLLFSPAAILAAPPGFFASMA
jgi:hypothetical protein